METWDINITKMKALYSKIKELLPDLKTSPQETGKVLTMIGFMMDELKKVQYQNKEDYLIGLEVRQNRADCLSIIGIAWELAAYYNLEMKLPEVETPLFGEKETNIKIEATDFVKRVSAVEINGLKNSESPAWLKEFLNLYDFNSVNLLVDLSNYVMIYTGYPSHLLDKEKIQDNQISWTINKDFENIVTLDGSEIKLNKNNKNSELIIRDSKNVLALAGIVGGQAAEIDLNTQSIIAEMAIYDRTIIRKNSRNLKIVTEASSRLEKDLDPNGIDYAMNLLVSLILKSCGGNLTTKLYNYYPKKRISPTIEFNPKLPSIYAGIAIPEEKTVEILKNLRFKVEKPSPGPSREENEKSSLLEENWKRTSQDKLLVTPPTDRMDISVTEDVIEEVVRIVGYNNIPPDQIPKLAVVNNITPKIIYLADRIRDILISLSFDEILSLPLVGEEDNKKTNYLPMKMVVTQNSINKEYPDLRQSIASGLLAQWREYRKKNVEQISIFEIGKVFGKKENEYREHNSLGVLVYKVGSRDGINDIKNVLEILLRSIGSNNIYYSPSEIKPEIANPYSCWDIITDEKKIGILYKLKPQERNGKIYFFELNLAILTELLGKVHRNPVVEITQKLVVLDTNIELAKDESIMEFIKKVRQRIGSDNLWSISVSDIFPLPDGKIRYTVKVSYQKLSDQQAKKLHKETFGN